MKLKTIKLKIKLVDTHTDVLGQARGKTWRPAIRYDLRLKFKFKIDFHIIPLKLPRTGGLKGWRRLISMTRQSILFHSRLWGLCAHRTVRAMQVMLANNVTTLHPVN